MSCAVYMVLCLSIFFIRVTARKVPIGKKKKKCHLLFLKQQALYLLASVRPLRAAIVHFVRFYSGWCLDDGMDISSRVHGGVCVCVVFQHVL